MQRLPATLSLLITSLAATPLLGQTPPVQEQSESAPAPAPAPLQPALEVGDMLPPVAITELSQAQAGSFSEFYGRVVLLEFFAYWCGPCALSVPHLNELQKKYGARGFSVVAVTTESAKKTLPWIEKNGVEYTWGRDAGELHRLFQVRTIPSAALIDSFGMVQWIGDPRRLREETIEGALAAAFAQPVWEWPEDARPLAQLLERGEFATALQEAAKLPAREGFDPQALVRSRIAPLVTRFEGLVERSEYTDAFRLGERLEKGLATLPEGEQLAARMNALRADPEIMRQVTAETRLVELETRTNALRNTADAKQLRGEVATFLESKPGSKFEPRAKILLDALDRGLEKAEKAEKAGAKTGKKPQ